MQWEDWCWCWMLNVLYLKLNQLSHKYLSFVFYWFRVTYRWYLLTGNFVCWLCLISFWRNCVRHWSSFVDCWVILFHCEVGLQDVHEECLFSVPNVWSLIPVRGRSRTSPRRGSQSLGGSPTQYFSNIFWKTLWKLKKFWSVEGRMAGVPPKSTTACP